MLPTEKTRFQKMFLWLSRLSKNEIFLTAVLSLIVISLFVFYNSFTYVYIAKDVLYDAAGSDGTYTAPAIIVYILIAVCAILLIAILFDKWGVRVNERFVIFTIPFVALVGVVRVCEDAKIISYPMSIFFVSPMIYVVAALVFLTIVKLFKINGGDSDRRMLKYVFVSIVLFWFLDALTTFIGYIAYGYNEKNLISLYIIDRYGPFWFIVEKVMFAVMFCVVFDYRHYLSDNGDSKLNNIHWFFVISMIALSLAPAIRNALRMGMGI